MFYPQIPAIGLCKLFTSLFPFTVLSMASLTPNILTNKPNILY